MKDDTKIQGPFEYGDWRLGGQGTRTDILAVTDRIQEGATAVDVSSEFPCTFIKYHRGIEKLVHYSEKQRTQPPEIILLYGPTGTGKTKWCYDHHPTLYRKPCDTRWFDRYTGNEVLLLDDFGGAMSKMSLLYLLQLLDRYPLIVEAKGSHVNMMATTILITTNHHPRKWYDYEKRESSYDALERRIHKVMYFAKFGDEPTNCDMHCFFVNFFDGMDPTGYIQEAAASIEVLDCTTSSSEESSSEGTQPTVEELSEESDDDLECIGGSNPSQDGRDEREKRLNNKRKLGDAFVPPNQLD